MWSYYLHFVCFSLTLTGEIASAFTINAILTVVSEAVDRIVDEVDGVNLRPLRKDAEVNRMKVLDSARELFARYGLQTTLDEIAIHAGVGVGTVYRRFANKEALVEALFEQRVQAIVDLANDSLKSEDSWAGFVYFLKRLMSMEAADKGLRELVHRNDRGGDRVQRLKQQIEAPVRRLVDRAKRDGYLRADFSATDIVILTAMVGTADEYCANVGKGIWERYLVFLLDGLRVSRDSITRVPYDALSDEEIKEAMNNWKRRYQRPNVANFENDDLGV